MLATFKLLNSYFWKTIYGPILAFVLPLVLLGIMGNTFRLEYIYPGIIALSMMLLGVIALPLAIMELKNSSLFKYIGSSPVNPIKFTSVVIGYYAFISICTGIVIFLGTMAIFPTSTFPTSGFSHGVLGGIFTLKGAFSFYIGCIIHLAFVIMTGLVVSTFARTPQQALTFGVIIVLPSMFLSGMVLSVDVIGQSPVMNWISRIIPFRYSTANLVVSATPLDQLGSSLNFFLHKPVSNPDTNYPSNFWDQFVWPYKNLDDVNVRANISSLYQNQILAGGDGKQYLITYDPKDTTTYKSVTDYLNSFPSRGFGYTGFLETKLPESIFGVYNPKNPPKTLKVGDGTLYFLLKTKMDAMTLNSDNNIFNWTENWGVRKVPSVESIEDFVTNYFHGADANGNPLPASDNGGAIGPRVISISNQILSGHFDWLDLFLNQSNILYYQADRVLNILLPLALSGGGAWYVFKNFSWAGR